MSLMIQEFLSRDANRNISPKWMRNILLAANKLNCCKSTWVDCANVFPAESDQNTHQRDEAQDALLASKALNLYKFSRGQHTCSPQCVRVRAQNDLNSSEGAEAPTCCFQCFVLILPNEWSWEFQEGCGAPKSCCLTWTSQWTTPYTECHKAYFLCEARCAVYLWGKT